MLADRLYRACLVVLALFGQVGFVRHFRRVKQPNARVFAFDLNDGQPLATLFADTKVARFVVAVRSTSVFRILCDGNLTKILNAVIRAIPIEVVKVLGRPFAMHVQPRQPVGQERPPKNADAPIAHAVRATSNISNASVVACSDTPGEDPGQRVVVQKFAQYLRGKIRGSHEALQLLIGQRPACVSSTGGLRYFSSSMFVFNQRS